MSSVWNRILALLFSLSLVLGLVGCAPSQSDPTPEPDSTPVLEGCPVIEDTDFGGVYLDITIDEFNDLGFSFGDCVSIYFSNGYKLEYIPYYNGYYTLRGDPLLVGYPGYPHIAAKINSGDSLWQVAHLVEGDTATVVLEQHEGPYLIHCIEGKDRTGFVCMLLEALAGASYEEILDDYMATYENYYGITRESHPEQYYAVADLMLRDMLCYIADLESDADLTRVDYYEPARAYLRKGGMTDEQIDALVAILIDGEAQELREAA